MPLPSKFQLSTSLPEEISTDLGSTVSDNARLEDELSLIVGRASAVFGKLRERL